ncbi:MAG: hypothetical protein ACOYMN_07625, partial [Roseimicrobium sp.]
MNDITKLTLARPASVRAGTMALVCLCLSSALCGADPARPRGAPVLSGDDALRLRLEQLATSTEKGQTTVLAPPGPSAAPQAPLAAPGTANRQLFETDFDKVSAISYTQRRVVLLVFSPTLNIEVWRNAPELQPWAKQVVICPVNTDNQGDRALRLAKAFGFDPVAGGLFTALVRAPDGAKQVAPDQLLYQVLARDPEPRDVLDVFTAMQKGVSAYEQKRSQYAWDAVLVEPGAPPPIQPPPASSTPAMPSEPAPGPVAAPPPPPATELEPSAFEKSVLAAWNHRKPLVLVFPRKTQLDARSVSAAFGALPKAMAPEHLVLT